MSEFPTLIEPVDQAPDTKTPESAGEPVSEQDDRERRRSMRFRSDAEDSGVTIWASPEQKIAGILIDESRNGTAVIVGDGESLKAGQAVDINYYGVQTAAIVRYVRRDDDGTCRIGIEWK